VSLPHRLHKTLHESALWFQRDVFQPPFTGPAAWCFAAVWAAAAIYLAAMGRGRIVLQSICLLAVLCLFCAVTVATTKAEHQTKAKLPPAKLILLWLQIAAILFFVSMTLYTSLMLHGVVPPRTIPVWSSIVDTFSRLGERIFSSAIVVNPALALANPAEYFLLPLPLLLLLGARCAELGFRRGHRTWRVVALWCVIPAGVMVYLLALGHLSGRVLARRLPSHLLINGFSEEFLFRGALQTRLRILLGSSWAIVIQAMIFGIWHFGAGFGWLGITSSAAVIASCVVRWATFGLAFGIIFQRTRNLLACSVIHVVINSLGR
jgi:membrane protease YdiL (CAAX protease family)